MTDGEIRTRIAPSPTGLLHVGTARSALFNELFTRQRGGQLIMRIEDTDSARSKKKFEDDIIEGLNWLGIKWDQEPIWQSTRKDEHRDALQRLLTADLAYQKDGEEAIRLRVEPQEIQFKDLIRGKITVHTDMFGGDFVIARAIDDPLYHLAVVVDDEDMQISHVIRGEDHLSNTPKHVLLQRALGYKEPAWAHIPLLLDEKRRKLSKRQGETSVLSYRDQGYLPEALLNYLALLGWNPGDEREYFSHQELVKAFSLAKVQKGGAVFSIEKLTAINKHYLAELPTEDVWQRAKSFFSDEWRELDEAFVQQAISTEQTRVANLRDLPAAVSFFSPSWSAEYESDLLIWKKSDQKKTLNYLQAIKEKLETIKDDDYYKEKLEEILITWLDVKQQWGRGDVLWPMRVALTGQANSPGPFEVAAVLGKKEVIKRLEIAINKL